MTRTECRAVISLSTLMGLRMIGLFMVLPVFTLYAQHLSGATPALIGLAMGVYGLSQALLQIPFGALSDHWGRKPVILIGLVIFAIGSLLAGLAHSIVLMMIARALQGAGAVGSTILAMMADLTREEQRTKSMAIAGMTIGFSFMVAMLLGPLLTKWWSVSGLFYLAALFGLLAIALLYTIVPSPQFTCWHRDTEPELSAVRKILFMPALAKLNSGIFILHAIFTASFVVIPISLLRDTHLSANLQWHFYLPALLVAFLISLICIGMAERKQQVKPYFIGSIVTLALSELLFWMGPTSIAGAILGLCLFFTGFSLLEAFLPSLISRAAPVTRKGTALGIYSCSQFFGIFVGGALGGWIDGQVGLSGVYLFCLLLTCIWFVIAINTQPPRYLINQMLRLSVDQQKDWQHIAAKLRLIPGMVDVILIAEEGIAYLKMERTAAKHPDFIRLKSSQSEFYK